MARLWDRRRTYSSRPLRDTRFLKEVRLSRLDEYVKLRQMERKV
jgi:hypothetical protein